jgi:hypothetical protein
MGMRKELQARAKWGGILRGIGVAAVFVLVNAVVAVNLIPSSYQQFTWEAYAGTVYTPTSTPTNTPTATATATPTITRVPNGGSCATPSVCQSGFCVEGICCNTICNQPMQTCEDGTCSGVTAPAPAVSHRTLGLILALLVTIGFFALAPLRFGKRR